MKFSQFAALSCTFLAFAYSADATSTTDFTKNASIANNFEITSSQVALDRSQNSDVKAFAQQMVDDHSKVGDDFKSTLQADNMDPTTLPTMDKKHQKIIDMLKNDSAGSFDKDYVKAQLSAHKDAVKLFTSYSKSGDDANLKAFAGRNLPTLQSHLDHVKDLKSKM